VIAATIMPAATVMAAAMALRVGWSSRECATDRVWIVDGRTPYRELGTGEQ